MTEEGASRQIHTKFLYELKKNKGGVQRRKCHATEYLTSPHIKVIVKLL